MADAPVPSPTLGEVRERWAPEWRVWRSRNDAGTPNEWCATYQGANPEISRTLMEPTAQELEAALRRAQSLPVVPAS